MNMDSPKGLMLHGEVGTGKSMLIDLFADCLPNRKKARWHFNTFILETFAKLEELRRHRLGSRIPASVNGNGSELDDYSLLWLARDLIDKSPILFLDEFQLPDRAASKIMTNLMTSFFQLGGVLVATSNRMPEELHKAAGATFAPPPSRMDSLVWKFGLGGRSTSAGRSDNMFAGQNEFSDFLDVLKARCEVWEMQGGKDYRRQEIDFQAAVTDRVTEEDNLWQLDEQQDLQRAPGMSSPSTVSSETAAKIADELAKKTETTPESASQAPKAPKNYLIKPAPDAPQEEVEVYSARAAALSPLVPSDWQPGTLQVYGRLVTLPRTNPSTQTASFTFAELCTTITFGPADYISLASAYHTIILTHVPILSLLQKNDARRFITLLDALYEAKCKLLILDAEAGPDELFFPTATTNKPGNSGQEEEPTEDAVYAETFSEAYQDATAPFRPNILASNPDFAEERSPDYTHARFHGALLPPDALEDDPPNRVRRASPFSRNTNAGTDAAPIDPDNDLPYLRSLQDRAIHPDDSSPGIRGARGGGLSGQRGGPDFSHAGAFTGEDEKFAFKRATSRLWEMCGAKWWAREGEDWHRPLPAHIRRWERRGWGGSSDTTTSPDTTTASSGDVGSERGGKSIEAATTTTTTTEGMGKSSAINERNDAVLFARKSGPSPLKRAPPASAAPPTSNHEITTDNAASGLTAKERADARARVVEERDKAAEEVASPFRVVKEAPPVFGWTHFWGTMKWGPRAGRWGQGVEGLEGRKDGVEEVKGEKGGRK